MAGPESRLGSLGTQCHRTLGMQRDGLSPRAERAGHSLPGVPTLPPGPGQQSEPGAAPLGVRGSVSSFQPRHPGSGVRDQPLPLCSILCSWLAAVVVHSLPGGKRGQTPVLLLLQQVPGLQPEREGTTAAPGHLGGERRVPSPPAQGLGRRMLGGAEGQGGTQQCHIPSAGPASAQVGGSLLWWEGMTSRCQAVGRLGGALGPLDDGCALLPPQQLVVLKEALIAGHAVRAIREGQETWGGEARAGSEEAGMGPGKEGWSGRCWKGLC